MYARNAVVTVVDREENSVAQVERIAKVKARSKSRSWRQALYHHRRQDGGVVIVVVVCEDGGVIQVQVSHEKRPSNHKLSSQSFTPARSDTHGINTRAAMAHLQR